MGGLSLGFATPWLLWGLAALPILWLILKAVPPAPIRRQFPGVILLLGLRDKESVSSQTPWWLLLLRMLTMAALIVGLAGPVLKPEEKTAGSGPLLILLDASWASAPDWDAKIDLITALLDDAGKSGRPVAMMRLTEPKQIQFQSADVWQSRLTGMPPLPWQPSGLDDFADMLGNDQFDTFWISDGLQHDNRAEVLAQLLSRGEVMVFETGRPVIGLAPAEFKDGKIWLSATRSDSHITLPIDTTVLVQGRDPSGTERVLASAVLSFAPGATSATTTLSLPAELRARISRFELQGAESAGAVALSDDRLRRSEVALILGRDDREGLQLLSPLHYLRQALLPSADLLGGALLDVLPANPDVVVLADVATITDAEEQALLGWISKGGLLLRFAGPRLAASDLSRTSEHPLMPVRLRSGGRSVGGAMSWGEPKSLAPFHQDSPFFGLSLPQDVRVSAQVVAQPDPTLANRVIAELSDGTPLVTRKKIGQGQVVLFHVTANAEWSGLPLSGLFVQMLERLAVSGATGQPSAEELKGTIWTPDTVLDAFGRQQQAHSLSGVPGETLTSAPLGAKLPPGLYSSNGRMLARNVISANSQLTSSQWPINVPVHGLQKTRASDLSGILLGLAVLLFSLDVAATLALSGRLRGANIVAGILAIALWPIGIPSPSLAQDQTAIATTREVTLGHILTGDRALDDRALAGLRGLSNTLFYRTSVEPAAPVSVNLETDEIAFFPLLYWPITPAQPRPSNATYDKLNSYLRNGGMILFDTADGDIAGFSTASPNRRKLQSLARPLNIPALERLPRDHVLSRTFYLLQDWPGRYNSHDVWVEAAPAEAEQIAGMPFRNLNDGVTPVVIGGNDWAGAWAIDTQGNHLYPVGRGRAGERQRELAYRFGVNLVMHVLTGNYKSDQVHVPALLDRLGQ